VLRAAESTCSDFVAATPGPPPLPAELNLSSVTAASATISWTPAAAAESWSFVPGRYQPGYDISCTPGLSVDELKALCEASGQCEGFTTDGCLMARVGFVAVCIGYAQAPSPPPPPRTNRTRRVPHPVLIGHAAFLTPY